MELETQPTEHENKAHSNEEKRFQNWRLNNQERRQVRRHFNK